MGKRSKFLVLDKAKILKLTGAGTAEDLRRNHEAMIAEALTGGNLEREPEWTESIGVGSREFVIDVAEKTSHHRVQLQVRQSESGLWTLREPESSYGKSGGSSSEEAYEPFSGPFIARTGPNQPSEKG